MSLDSTTSSTTTDPLGRPSAATTPDVDVAAQTTTPSTAPTTPPASPPLPPAQDLPYCASPQPATAAELPAETEYPPARIDDDDEDDNAPGPSVFANMAGSSSKEKRKGGGEGAEGEQARDKRVRKTRHKRRPSSQHRSVPIACMNWQACHGRKADRIARLLLLPASRKRWTPLPQRARTAAGRSTSVGSRSPRSSAAQLTDDSCFLLRLQTGSGLCSVRALTARSSSASTFRLA
jgi:hypothetical protein